MFTRFEMKWKWVAAFDGQRMQPNLKNKGTNIPPLETRWMTIYFKLKKCFACLSPIQGINKYGIIYLQSI